MAASSARAPAPAPAPLPPHHDPSGGFRNPWPSDSSLSANGNGGFFGFLKLRLTEWRSVDVPPDLSKVLPVRVPDFAALARPPVRDAVQTTWIGHATFLLQFDGLNVVTDPIFSERCSASQLVGPKRFVPPPLKIEQLPEQIDLVVISHNHYDHTDTNSIDALRGRVSHWCVPLGIGEWLRDQRVPAERIVELDWWGERELALPGGRVVRVVCTPSQHFSGRSLTDRNRTLWCSWAVLGPTQRVWFAGDTGYRSVPRGVGEEEERKLELPVCPAFREIGAKFGPFDLACIPIGAYSPRWFMSPVHLDPYDAVKVHSDVRARRSVGMHWGTFVLTDEPILEPPQRLREALRALGRGEDEFLVLQHGETRIFGGEAQAAAPAP